MSIATLILDVAVVYVTVGFLFAIYFVTVGLERFDHQTTGAPLSFRLIIIPGATLLWPVIVAINTKRRRGGS